MKLSQLFATLIIFGTLIVNAFAQSTVSQIQDTVYNSNGTLFNGSVLITWTGSGNPTGNAPAPYNTSAKIYNGVFAVLLVPSTTQTPPSFYQAVFNSSDGLVTWTEMWQVPPSGTPLTLSQVRVSSASTGSGGTTAPQISMSQVTGLTADISALNGSLVYVTSNVNEVSATVSSMESQLATLTATVNAPTPTGTNYASVDNESPAGTIDGTNATFTLSGAPSPTNSLLIYRNGTLQTQGIDYTLSGSTVAFAPTSTPLPGDILESFYRIAGAGPAVNFADDETPQGTVNGSNLNFTVSVSPSPASSLRLYKNGILMKQGVDYTLSGSSIAFANTATPQQGDSVIAFYRH